MQCSAGGRVDGVGHGAGGGGAGVGWDLVDVWFDGLESSFDWYGASRRPLMCTGKMCFRYVVVR
eukprot:10532768-Alexandrium_andersonii.AAC.1